MDDTLIPSDIPNRTAAVPQGRTRRLVHLGLAVSEMAAGAALEGASRLARGEALTPGTLLLTPGNARRLAERLSTLRGAAMKLGQLMSMDGQGVLPPAFADLLAGLRERAHIMPATQLVEVLEAEYGEGWDRRFRRFSFQPIASASIGQVHRAETHTGRLLAIKLQYPGVRQSIDSDVANIALLARTPGLIPAGMAKDVAPLLARLREQLLIETDYLTEARLATEYRQKLGDDAVLRVPQVYAPDCTANILAMDFEPGLPIDQLAKGNQPQALRDHVAAALCRLAVRELFEMRLVQTDPNFGNYLFDQASGQIALLDFGATQAVSSERVEQLRGLGCAVRDGDAARTLVAARSLGLLGESDDADSPSQVQALVELLLMLGEPLRYRGDYDFGASDLIRRVFDLGQAQLAAQGYARTPPPDLMWLQRKFVGTFLLCVRLRARVNLAAVFGEQL